MFYDLRWRNATKTSKNNIVIEYIDTYAHYNLQTLQINNEDTYISCLIWSKTEK